MIYAGNLNEWLEFYRLVDVQSESGFKTSKEVLRLRIKAHRLKNKENYLVDAEAIFHSSEIRFQMRYRKIDLTDIVIYDNERYRITSIDVNKAANEMVIIVQKIND